MTSQAVQVDPSQPDHATTLVQTVMTLCQCTYVPQARFLTEEGTIVPTTEDREMQTEEPESNRVAAAVQAGPEPPSCEVEVQTELLEAASPAVVAEGNIEQMTASELKATQEPVVEGDPVQYSVDTTLAVEEHTFTFSATSATAEDTFTLGASESSSEDTLTLNAPASASPAQETTSASETVGQIVVSKPEETTSVEFTFTFNLDAQDSKDSQADSEAHFSIAGDSIQDSENIDCERAKKGSRDPGGPFAGYLLRRKSLEDSMNGGGLDITQPPQLPHSPMIRSKYPRKQRTTDFRLHQIYIDTCGWKATPLRKKHRNRRPNSDKPYHSRSGTPASDNESSEYIPSLIRERTSSDSSMLHHRALSAPMKESGSSELTVRLPQVLGTNQSSPASPTSLDPFPRDIWLRKSPSPGLRQRPMVSPVRKLKTAAELLRESERKRRSTSSSQDNIMERSLSTTLSTSSSDKENDKQQKLAADFAEGKDSRPPEPPTVTPAEVQEPFNVRKAVSPKPPKSPKKRKTVPQKRRTPSPTPPPSPTPSSQPPSTPITPEVLQNDPKPPLKDRTNESKVKKMKAILSSGQQDGVSAKQKSQYRSDTGRARDKDRPKSGLVARQAELFQTKGKSDQGPVSQTCKTKAVTVTVTAKAVQQTTCTEGHPSHRLGCGNTTLLPTLDPT